MQAPTQRLFRRSSFFGHKRRFALVPQREQLSTGCRANETRVNEAGKAHAGQVATRTVHAFNVPTSFAGTWKVIRQKTATIFLGKGARETPFIAIQTPEIEQFHLKQVAWLSSWNGDRSRQVMALSEEVRKAKKDKMFRRKR